MTNQNKISRLPLLYIAKPDGNDIVEVNMQSYAKYKKQDKKLSSINIPVQVEEEQVLESEVEVDEKKPFREMTVKEKIIYLISMPKQMPRMKCEVLVDDERYRGIIYSFENDIVKMKTFQRPYKAEFAYDAITDIRLKGF